VSKVYNRSKVELQLFITRIIYNFENGEVIGKGILEEKGGGKKDFEVLKSLN
jgi:hypothetical protein